MIAIRKPTPQRLPEPPIPILVEPDWITKLGELKARTWFTVPPSDAEYELLDDPPIRDADPHRRLSDGALYLATEVAGVRAWRPTRRHPAGTFAAGGKVSAARRKVARSRPVDELARWFPKTPESLITVFSHHRDVLLQAPSLEPYVESGTAPKQGTVHSLIKPAQPSPRGAAAILAKLAKRGITLRPTIDGAFYVESERGALDHPTRDAIAAAAPLLRPYLHGTPLRCALPNHVGGEPPEAMTITLGGAGWCGEC